MSKKVAIIHDWLVGMRGGEHCLDRLLTLYPDADVYTMLLDREKLSPRIQCAKVFTSRTNTLPGVLKYYRHLLPFYPRVAQEISEKLSEYDLVISVSHAWAKNVQPQGQHLCYCLSPMRYIWDQFEAYFSGRMIEPVARRVAKDLRNWDRGKSTGVDSFLGISQFIQKRISRVYEREAGVVYPPVRQDWITPRAEGEKGEGFLVVNALVPYKNTELIVKAFNQLKLPLTIIGSGPEEKKLRSIAKPNIRFIPFASEAELSLHYRKSKAMVFAAVEDFGMTPVEMQAAGRPVIALGQGGALETVSVKKSCRSGTFFENLSIESLTDTVSDFLDQEGQFNRQDCIENAQRFLPEHFDFGIKEAVNQLVSDGRKLANAKKAHTVI